MKKFLLFLSDRVNIPNWWLFVLLALAILNASSILYYLFKISIL